MTREFTKDKLKVQIYSSRQAMGNGAAAEAVAYLKELLRKQERVNIIYT